MFVDSITIIVKAGNGGNGAATFRRTAQTAFAGPDGGNGGHGGDVYFQGSHNETDLSRFRYKKKISAENGQSGRSKNVFGKNAQHRVITLPLGTLVKDVVSGDTFEIKDESKILIVRGGIGGRGNVVFKSATNRTPRNFEIGGIGEERKLFLDLRVIAAVGLIGLPNAGKSSLLAVLTNATPKVGNYPFTTLHPSVGMMGPYTIADIPGLIEGASEGKGLGIKFLKHIVKTKMLLHCIDSSETDSVKVYDIVRREFAAFNPELLVKPEVIVLTKTDLADPKRVTQLKSIFEKKGKKILTSSVYDVENVKRLKTFLMRELQTNEGNQAPE